MTGCKNYKWLKNGHVAIFGILINSKFTSNMSDRHEKQIQNEWMFKLFKTLSNIWRNIFFYPT